MGISKCFTMALSSIVNSKVRSFLTMLGIIIGVGAVIALTSMMNGLTGMITESYEDMGTETITVSITSRGTTREVTPEQMQQLVDDNPDLLRSVTPNVSVSGAIKHGTDSVTTAATGVSEAEYDIGRLTIAKGRFLEYLDMVNESKVCVIGSYEAKEFFGTIECVDEYIKINGEKFKIVGVLEEGADSEQRSSDDCIYIPYTIARKMARSTVVNSYTLAALNDDTVDEATDTVEALLLQEIGDDDYYDVTNMKEIIEDLTSMIDTMEIALVFIAGISLLVAGIGIMNIMLVTVTERTKEIGIRKSLGARKRNIMQQFVIEAGTISSVGGIIGIIFGFVGANLVGRFLDLTAVPSTGSIALAFGVSLFIGVAFGFLPANKAAKLNPIDALRHE